MQQLSKSDISFEINVISRNFFTKIVFVFVFPSYYLYILDLRLDFGIWLNEAHFGHDDPYYFDYYKRTMHHRIMK